MILQKDAERSIAIWDPFSMPKALVAMPIEGIEMLPFIKDKAKVGYVMTFDEAEETTWQAIRSRVEERSNDNTLVRINLSDGVDAVSMIKHANIEANIDTNIAHLYFALDFNFFIISSILNKIFSFYQLGQSALGELKPANIEKLTVLNLDIEEDRKFVEEMQLLNAIADNAFSTKKHDSDTDVYWIVVSALKPVLDLHGNTSEAAEEAYTLLNDCMERISKAFVNAYDGKVYILLVLPQTLQCHSLHYLFRF